MILWPGRVSLYRALLRVHLESRAQVWEHTARLGCVQRWALELGQALEHRCAEEQLGELGVFRPEQRRLGRHLREFAAAARGCCCSPWQPEGSCGPRAEKG